MLTIGKLAFDTPAVMGILNITPDSFSDGGRFRSRDDALRQAESMAAEGAEIIDVGGESTRPGAGSVSEQEELDRVLPVIEGIVASLDVVVSIDTSKAAVMRAAVSAGASMINDIRALQDEGALQAAVAAQCPVCIMHMQGEPRTMQSNPAYEDVVAEVRDFLLERVDTCIAAGIDNGQIIIDPGFGFGKSPAHNVELLANLRQFTATGLPVLAGLSRKSTLGELTGRDVGERMAASVAAAVVAAMQGASIVRAHDVRETIDALRVVRAVREQEDS